MGFCTGLRGGNEAAESVQSSYAPTVEPWEPSLFLGAETVEAELLATSPASLSKQAIEIDLRQENQQAQESEPLFAPSYLAPAEDHEDVADAGALANPAEPALPGTNALPSVQDQLGSALEALLESEGLNLQFQDDSSCPIAVDQQDAIPGPEDLSMEARAPPAQEGLDLSGLSFVDCNLALICLSLGVQSFVWLKNRNAFQLPISESHRSASPGRR